MSGNFTFVIVGKKDNPTYELIVAQKKEDSSHMNQFIIHAALDIVEEQVWTTSSMFLKTVDRFNTGSDLHISAYVTAGHVKFMLLHEGKNEDNIKSFFTDVHELYMKILLNPFYEVDTPITSQVFDARVKLLAASFCDRT
eukprot:CAMPEP_0114563738 /NCGR_PEP_ID=MMETSP0114-20121206/13292_1 /TAXON_ID=31324 /ORGANISM="Goniomonas sp, Strain m" /LENGTH=139 /DNA_ID=CAMNT_0001749649 /DNA_START=16 /DNA_END=432 /DNA_ORIENTATION=+